MISSRTFSVQVPGLSGDGSRQKVLVCWADLCVLLDNVVHVTSNPATNHVDGRRRYTSGEEAAAMIALWSHDRFRVIREHWVRIESFLRSHRRVSHAGSRMLHSANVSFRRFSEAAQAKDVVAPGVGKRRGRPPKSASRAAASSEVCALNLDAAPAKAWAVFVERSKSSAKTAAQKRPQRDPPPEVPPRRAHRSDALRSETLNEADFGEQKGTEQTADGVHLGDILDGRDTALLQLRRIVALFSPAEDHSSEGSVIDAGSGDVELATPRGPAASSSSSDSTGSSTSSQSSSASSRTSSRSSSSSTASSLLSPSGRSSAYLLE